MAISETAITIRHFTLTTYIASGEKVLLVFHKKWQVWLAPGGHLEPQEIPDEGALREVREETGLEVRLTGYPGLDMTSPKQLIRPEGVQLEGGPNHDHINLIYFAVPANGCDTQTVHINKEESEQIHWFSLEEMTQKGIHENVRAWAALAIERAKQVS